MVGKRRYQLLCPVARALDAVGDRWSLLILRDLHAGPARFQQLQEGLGMATNLLTSRLAELVEAGLLRRLEEDQADGRRSGAYALTELGRSTDRLLWELVRFGGRLDRDPDPRKPGNLRTVALPLAMMLRSVEGRPSLVVRLLIDDDTLLLRITPGEVDVVHESSQPAGGDWSRAEPDVILRTTYEGFLDLAEGRMGLEEFVADHREVLHGADRAAEFGSIMAQALRAAEQGLV
ncbi:MAG: helix-turn-helix domain-containing protein [Actinomycetota bacterium]